MAEQKKMKVILIRHTLSPEETIALGAKLCYSKSTIENLTEKISEKDQSAFIEKLKSFDSWSHPEMLMIVRIADMMHARLLMVSPGSPSEWLRHCKIPQSLHDPRNLQNTKKPGHVDPVFGW